MNYEYKKYLSCWVDGFDDGWYAENRPAVVSKQACLERDEGTLIIL